MVRRVRQASSRKKYSRKRHSRKRHSRKRHSRNKPRTRRKSTRRKKHAMRGGMEWVEGAYRALRDATVGAPEPQLEREQERRLKKDQHDLEIRHQEQIRELSRLALGVKEDVQNLMDESEVELPADGRGPAVVGDDIRLKRELLNTRINTLHYRRENAHPDVGLQIWRPETLNALQEELKQLSERKGIPVNTWINETDE